MATKAILMVTLTGDGVSTHDQTVRQAILDNSDLQSTEVKYSSELPVSNSIQDVLDYASSIGAICIKPDNGISSILSGYTLNYDDILIVMPLGSNTYAEITDPTEIPVIVTCGAGISTAGNNQTGYGNGLEFWDRETYGASGTAESSYSNGVIAGKLYAIKLGRNCGWWEARYCARMTASNKGVWDIYNGYGLINVEDAISYADSIPQDPYLSSTVIGMTRLSDNFKFWGQTDVTFADLTKPFAFYESTANL